MKEIRKRNIKRRDEVQGSILIIGVAIIAFLLFLAVPFLFQLSVEKRDTGRSSKYSAALSLAEAGVEKAIWEMNYGDISRWKGDSSLRTLTIPSFLAPEGNMIGDIEIRIREFDGERPVVESTGRVLYTSSLGGSKTARIVLERSTRVVLERSEYGWTCSFPKKQIPTPPIKRSVI